MPPCPIFQRHGLPHLKCSTLCFDSLNKGHFLATLHKIRVRPKSCISVMVLYSYTYKQLWTCVTATTKESETYSCRPAYMFQLADIDTPHHLSNLHTHHTPTTSAHLGAHVLASLVLNNNKYRRKLESLVCSSLCGTDGGHGTRWVCSQKMMYTKIQIHVGILPR